MKRLPLLRALVAKISYLHTMKKESSNQWGLIHCKTKTGKVICEESEVLERREVHFKELLNKEVEDERMEQDETDVESVQKGKKGKMRE